MASLKGGEAGVRVSASEDTDYDAFDHLSAILSRDGREWLLAMFDLELYLDDSGTHDGALVAVAACYLSTRGGWKTFNRKWRGVLRREGLLEEGFHMTDFMAKPERGVLPYCNWNQSKRDCVYTELVSIIRENVRHGCAFAIPTTAFNENAPERFKEESAATPFTFAVQCVLHTVGQWYAEKGKSRAVQFVFEKRQGMMGQLMQLGKILEERSGLAASVGFRKDLPDGFSFQSTKFCAPLQAADVLAWNVRNHTENVILKDPPPPPGFMHRYFDQLWNPERLRVGFLQDWQISQGFADMERYEIEKGERGYLLPRKVARRLGSISQ